MPSSLHFPSLYAFYTHEMRNRRGLYSLPSVKKNEIPRELYLSKQSGRHAKFQCSLAHAQNTVGATCRTEAWTFRKRYLPCLADHRTLVDVLLPENTLCPPSFWIRNRKLQKAGGFRGYRMDRCRRNEKLPPRPNGKRQDT